MFSVLFDLMLSLCLASEVPHLARKLNQYVWRHYVDLYVVYTCQVDKIH